LFGNRFQAAAISVSLLRMQNSNWDEQYSTGKALWENGQPDSILVALVESGSIVPGRTLEIGCGTGINALYLASKGFDVHGLDVSPHAIATANARAEAAGAQARFTTHDFLTAELDDGEFDFVFDRAVLHVFDLSADRAQFARNVASVLHREGSWLSLAGSTEGPAREVGPETGPPCRSARDLVEAVEPALEIVELRSAMLDGGMSAWQLLARPREFPAQPSTLRHADGNQQVAT
jgi:SAM-dependent methyltransferase